MKNQPFCAIILAGGRGSRMGSGKPKVLREVDGKPLIYWSLKLVQDLNIEKSFVVVGHERPLVTDEIEALGFPCQFIEQNKLLGTAHALKTALTQIHDKFENVLVLFADDSSLYSKSSIENFLTYHVVNDNNATFLTSELDKPSDIGGLVIDDQGQVLGTMTKGQMEAKTISKHTILCGAFCFKFDWIKKRIVEIEKSLTSGEYPLPGIINVAKNYGEYISSYKLPKVNEWHSVNTNQELDVTNKLKKENIW